MKKIAVVLVLLASFCGSAFAEAPAPVDPATSAAVRKMLGAMNYRVTMSSAIAQMTRSMPAMMRSQMTGMIAADTRLTEAERQKSLAEFEKTMPRVTETVNTVLTDPAVIDEMIEDIIPQYARIYTIGEIEQMSAFYASPVGKKMLETMPQLMAAGMESSQRIVMPRLNKVMGEFLKPGAN